MKTHGVRVRFAPSPTGFMHLGNVSSALLNYLFAKQRQGTFILRIEDTDKQRNVDPFGRRIMEDLSWLGLNYNEGPVVGGPHEPYYQSERDHIYQKYLDTLKEKNLIYRCFCTVEELERKRERQIALKMPPRYDRTCLKLTQDAINSNLEKKVPYIWRFELNHSQSAIFFDLARKTMTFELKNFSDFALTRENGSFTFLFANFVDDLTMKITHIFRGEDHLTNTANQVALYNAFNVQIPIFWHLPIIGNKDGKKLSKRDFGFSLGDLKNGGFLPEAICNYLAIIGGGSYENEIISMDELSKIIDFEAKASTGQVRYDLEKLRWVNHQWIMNYNTRNLAALCYDFLKAKYTAINNMTTEDLIMLIKPIQKELVTLTDCVDLLEFYFVEPEISQELLDTYKISEYKPFIQELLAKIGSFLGDSDHSIHEIQKACRDNKMPMKDIFTLMRIALTGKPQGGSIKDLLAILGPDKSIERFKKIF